jgi:aspartate/methionine/tyrosine aminotransferase
VVENLIQYSTSGVAQFMQRAAIAALEHGDAFTREQIARARAGRDIIAAALTLTGRCRFALPQGAFYMFFQVEGESDTRALTFRLIDEGGIGLAPGTAFGAGGESFLRLCFARDAGQLREAAAALTRVLHG